MFQSTPVLLRRGSMAWKPIKYTATRRRNAIRRRTQQLMVDVELTKKYSRFIKNKPSQFEKSLEYNLEKNLNSVMKKVKEIQPVSLGKTKVLKRELVDQWFKIQAQDAQL